MAYNKTTWINKKVALSAANLNNIENGLEGVDLRTTKLEEDIKNIDVSEQINEHNISVTSHQDIRNAIENIDVSTQINAHNSNADAHSSILGSVALSTEDKTVKGAINETLNKVDVLNTNVGDTTTLKTSSKEVVGGINENVDEITALQTNKADKNPTGYSPSAVSIGCLGVINTRDNSTDTPPISDGWGTYLNSGGSRDFQIGYKWNDSRARLWYRTHSNDTDYRDWKQIATTDKIDISLIPVTGYKITLDHSYKMNNLLFVNIEVKTSDDSSFPLNSELRVVSYPVNLVKNINTSLCSSGIKNGYLKPNTSAFSYVNGSIYATTSVDVDTLRISGFVDLI